MQRFQFFFRSLFILTLMGVVRSLPGDSIPPIFDGQTLEGWTTTSGQPVTKGWEVVDGMIHRKSRGGHIVTAREYGDFELSFEWKIAEGGNSGVKYRVRNYGGQVLGCEYQVYDRGGKKPSKGATGSLYALYEPNSLENLKPQQEFNAAKIIVKGNKIEHWLNGERIVSATVGDEEWEQRLANSKFNNTPRFGANRFGKIMITDHGAEVWYRNFELKPLPMDDLRDRPNILWITAEDMSPTLGCYGDAYATTPHIDELAARSVRYTHAFATAPVCSPSRACLINGCIATTQGTHQMRSEFPIPIGMCGFPALLRDAGYYTTNNVKTDYNSANAKTIIAASWDDSSDHAHWRNRNEGQPFFSVFNLMTSHQSRTMVWDYEQFQKDVQSKLAKESIHDPGKAPVPPYYPDTPIVRQTIARYYDCVSVMDQEVGEILRQLDEDGLADETIVFFYSDHGSGMPRHKRALLDTGMQVPLLVHCPKEYRHLVNGNPGDTTERLVNFEDFGPTVLSLAGIPKLPRFMQGQAFLGTLAAEPRTYVHGHRDRIDEVVDLARSVRDARYLYIRNYMPHLGYNQYSAWVDESEMQREFYRLADANSMTPAQWHFAGPTRPREELYDCEADPLNLTNLVDSESHHEVLVRMRAEHRRWLVDSHDLGFLPETEQRKIAAKSNVYDWSRSRNESVAEDLFEAASHVGTQDADVFRANLNHASAGVRYWGAVGFSAASDLTEDDLAALRKALQDKSEIVKIEAANALARHDQLEPALLSHKDATVILYAARTIELLGQDAQAAHEDMTQLSKRFEKESGDLAWFIRFTTTGFLQRVTPPAADTDAK